MIKFDNITDQNLLIYRLRDYLVQGQFRWARIKDIMHGLSRQVYCSLLKQVINDTKIRPLQLSSASPSCQVSRRRGFFSSSVRSQQESNTSAQARVEDAFQAPKRKLNRTPKTSLLRVAVEAQTTRTSTTPSQNASNSKEGRNSTVTAISIADQFDMEVVSRILRSHGFSIDPDETGFESDQVIHTRGVNNGDIFVFPSGSIVAWSLPEDVVMNLATQTLLPAALNPHIAQIESEDLEYEEDPKRDSSSIKGDIILLGTKSHSQAESK